jgi:hypothetical protein
MIAFDANNAKPDEDGTYRDLNWVEIPLGLDFTRPLPMCEPITDMPSNWYIGEIKQ